ncbi:hypothetical protein [Kitasatospora saccharophila]
MSGTGWALLVVAVWTAGFALVAREEIADWWHCLRARSARRAARR